MAAAPGSASWPRLDLIQERGQLDALLASGARFAEQVLLVTAQRHGQLPTHRVRSKRRSSIFSDLAP